MAHRFLGSFVTEPYLTASVHRVGDVTIEIALVPATIRTIQVFVHRQDPGDGQLPVLRLADQEQVEYALPKPEQEGALESPVGETVPCDPGIGSLGPLPDASPDEAEVIEGVCGKAEGYLVLVFAIIDLYSRNLLNLGDAMDLLVAIRRKE